MLYMPHLASHLARGGPYSCVLRQVPSHVQSWMPCLDDDIDARVRSDPVDLSMVLHETSSEVVMLGWRHGHAAVPHHTAQASFDQPTAGTGHSLEYEAGPLHRRCTVWANTPTQGLQSPRGHRVCNHGVHQGWHLTINNSGQHAPQMQALSMEHSSLTPMPCVAGPHHS